MVSSFKILDLINLEVQERRFFMKKLVVYSLFGFVLALALFLSGCATLTLSKVENKYGPPSKVEREGDTITYYYYFYKGKVRAGAVGAGPVVMGSGELAEGWIVVEFVADSSGKVVKKKKYWKQPKLEPQRQPQERPNQ
jgi:hypothetical protein